jgi:hypothetical protein
MQHLQAIVLAAVLASPADGAPYTPEQISAGIKKNGGPEKFIRGIAANAAKMAGQPIDDQTELIGATALDRTLVYYVRLINYSKAEIKDLAALRREVALRNAASVCTAPTASVLIFEHSAEYKYIVYSKLREHLFEYSFTRTTCAKGHKW